MTSEQTRNLYFQLLRIRRVEEAIAAAYPSGEMKCPVHLSIGQEAAPVAMCAFLDDSDRVYSTHRCHAHYLAKGGDLDKMIAELYGKETGCARGKGGSMHLVDSRRGMMGASALVAGTIPLAVGSALAFALGQEPRVSVAFFGDGASEEGVFYESLNFAALKKLPVIFVCENNDYATYSRQTARQATPHIWRRGESFGVPGAQIDGADMSALLAASASAVARARRGEGPTLLEVKICRWKDHVGPAEDPASRHDGCPLVPLEHALADDERATMESTITAEIARAFAFARESAFPSAAEIHTDIYASH